MRTPYPSASPLHLHQSHHLQHRWFFKKRNVICRNTLGMTSPKTRTNNLGRNGRYTLWRRSYTSTRNPRVDQKWYTLDQNWSNPKIFFWDFWSGFFAQNSILVNYLRSWKNILRILIPSCIFRLDQKWSRVDQIWSNLGFRVGPLLVQGGPDLVQGGPLLVQPRVSSTVKHYITLFSKLWTG